MGKDMPKKYDFIAIDCEKASNNPASLCSIGIACFKNGRVKDTKEYIIRPVPFEFYAGSVIDDAYHNVPLNVYKNAPTFAQIWPKVKKIFKDNIIVGHGINGDLQTIQLSLNYYGIDFEIPGQDRCICTNIASIYTYPELESHKLKALCENLNIPVNPHHALSDAKACGYLLLDMLNVTDCKTAKDFVNICLEYNSIITTKYTDRNIEKYEEEIKEMFNHNDSMIELIFKNRENKIEDIIEYFKKFKPDYDFPKLNIVNCISPIIEIYKNEKYKYYIDELNKLNPFTHDGFIYLKTGEKEYTLFFGLLIDKIDLIYELILFLNRVSIPVYKSDFIGVAYKRVQKYRQTLYIMSNYLFEIEWFEEFDIYKYMEFFYIKQLQYFQSYDFERHYDILKTNTNPAQTSEIFKEIFSQAAKLIGLYLGLRDNFSDILENLILPKCLDGTFSLFNELLDLFEFSQNQKDTYNNFEYLTEKWYDENVGPVIF